MALGSSSSDSSAMYFPVHTSPVSSVLFVFRGLLQDTQEELEATQSQAHWIVLQQEAVIAETAKELIDISALVNKWLWKFGKPCSPDEVNSSR